MATFQERFNRLFDESELSQDDFGVSIGASRFQVYNWRSGRGEPDSEMLKVIAKKYRTSVSWLLGETDIRNTIEETFGRVNSAEWLALLCRLENLPEKDRKEIEAYIQFKEYIQHEDRKNNALGD